jgi:prepilin-type N-terminal cleavage/methylation domain-containing protein
MILPRTTPLRWSLRRRSRSAFASAATAARAGGFTLLEVLLAITIFAMIMTTLFSLLYMGSETLDRTLSRGDMIVRGRAAMDLLEADITQITFLNESDYNTTARRRLDDLEQRADEEEERGTSARDDEEAEEDSDYLLPPEIDLALLGEDDDQFDEISFAIYDPNTPRGFWAPWGMRRIHYFVRDGALYRSEDSVFKEDVLADGTVASKPAPVAERITDRVAYLDLKYMYWREGEWRLAPGWDSGEKRYRFPTVDVTADDLGMSEEDLQAQQESESTDDLPAMIQITLYIEDERRPGVVHPFQQSVRVYPSQETAFIPEYMRVER